MTKSSDFDLRVVKCEKTDHFDKLTNLQERAQNSAKSTSSNFFFFPFYETTILSPDLVQIRRSRYERLKRDGRLPRVNVHGNTAAIGQLATMTIPRLLVPHDGESL